MQRVFDHIDRIKEQPHHIRRQIAFTVAFGVAALIGLVWLMGSLAMGSFALGNTNFADATGAAPVQSSGGPDNSQLAGAAAAAPNTGAAAPAHIEIIDASTSTAPQPEQTVIPF